MTDYEILTTVLLILNLVVILLLKYIDLNKKK